MCHAFGVQLRYNEYNKNCLYVPCFWEIRYSEYTQITACLCLYGSFVLFMFRVCHAFLSVQCSLVVTCSEKANLLALLCVMFYCVFVTFPYGVLGQVWYLVVSIPGLCLLTYFGRYLTTATLPQCLLLCVQLFPVIVCVCLAFGI